jgi:adenosylmethionine-8-amino-7-oxononanoate aminotransferase
VLFVADCVIAGFGRLGTWLGIDRWPVRPDLIALAKGISGGALPVGALVVAPHVAEPFFTGRPGAPVLRHGATYAGHPACCAAANAALDLYEREGIIERGRLLERPLADALEPLAGHPLVAQVRAGLGALAGVDLSAAAPARDPLLPLRWQRGLPGGRRARAAARRRHRGVAAADGRRDRDRRARRWHPGGSRAVGARDARGMITETRADVCENSDGRRAPVARG